MILAYAVSSPVREKGDTEMPKRQPLSLGSRQATGQKVCQEAHLAQSVTGLEILGWDVEGNEREKQRRGSREEEWQVGGGGDGDQVFFQLYEVQKVLKGGEDERMV